jgi:hypothetical protein
MWYELSGCYIVSATADYGREIYKFDMIANKILWTLPDKTLSHPSKLNECFENIMKETLDHASDPSWSSQIFPIIEMPRTKKVEEKERWQDSWYDRYDKYEQKIS